MPCCKRRQPVLPAQPADAEEDQALNITGVCVSAHKTYRKKFSDIWPFPEDTLERWAHMAKQMLVECEHNFCIVLIRKLKASRSEAGLNL